MRAGSGVEKYDLYLDRPDDPIGLRGGLNLYAYAPNPLKYMNPLGLCKTDVGE